MKQHNVNAVRTSHYPNDPLWYELADQLRPLPDRRGQHRVPRLRHRPEEPPDQRPGVDAGVRRSHAAHGRARQEPPVGGHLVDGQRVRRRPQLRRHATSGRRRRDASRPVHYEGSIAARAARTPTSTRSCTRPRRGWRSWRRSAPTMPLLLCEYTHAMGNSNGGLKEYWDLFYSGAQHAGRVRVGLGEPGHPADRCPQPYRRQRPAETRSSPTAAGGKTGSASTTTRTSARTAWSRPTACRTPAWGAQVRLPVPARRARRPEPSGRIAVRNWFDFVNAQDVGDADRGASAPTGARSHRGSCRSSTSRPGQQREFTCRSRRSRPSPAPSTG